MDIGISKNSDKNSDVDFKVCKYDSGASDSTPPSFDNEPDTPVKVPITHSIQNKTWRDVHDVLPSTITLKT